MHVTRTEYIFINIPENYWSVHGAWNLLSKEMGCHAIEVNASDYGFESTVTPRTDRSVSKNIELGLAALRGDKGPAYDRTVLNAGMVDHLLGCDGSEGVSVPMDRAREAIDSGKALKTFLNYVKTSHKLK